MSVVEGNEVDLEVNLEQIFNEADTSQAPPQALEDEPKVQAEDSAVAKIFSEPDCLNAIYLRVRMTNRA